MYKIIRKISVLIGLAILVFGIRFSMSVGQPPATKTNLPNQGKKVTFVSSFIAKNQDINSRLKIDGKVLAGQRIDLFSEVSAYLVRTPKAFKNGTRFRKGDTLMILDNQDVLLELQMQKAQFQSNIARSLPDIENDYVENIETWQNYINQFDENKSIQALPTPKSERERLYILSKNLQSSYVSIKRLERQLTKYIIVAPFSGLLNDANVYEGTFIRAGQKLGSLSNPYDREIEATISLKDIPLLSKGAQVSIQVESIDKKWKAYVSRFDNQIDQRTQTQKVYLNVNQSGLLEGMNVQGFIQSNPIIDVIPVPRKLLLENDYIYIVHNDSLKREDQRGTYREQHNVCPRYKRRHHGTQPISSRCV